MYSGTPDRPMLSGTSDRPTYSGTPDRPMYSGTPDRPTYSSTSDQLLLGKHSSSEQSHSHKRPKITDQLSGRYYATYSSTPDQPTYSSTSDRPTYSSTLDPSVQEYCQIIKDKFSEWPVLQCGEEYFGRLSLVDRNAKNSKQWSITRGNKDIISQEHSKIEIEDVLKPNNSDQSLTVVIDGPPGIGKTTLCRKLLNLWANGELRHQQYDLVLYCPLRNIAIAQAKELEQLLNYNYRCPNVSMVTEWLERSHGKGLLIIFDGWDELSTQHRHSSLPTKIICKQLLHKCSVIVTSRSYASSSLLKLTSVNKHVQVMGFLEEEINTVIKGTLENNPQISQKLIAELQIRNDVYTLCYIPLICSIVIHVFEVNGQLPTTLTKLYENFILQAIRRYVANTGHYDPEDIQSLNEKHLPSNIATYFKEMCQFAYKSLKDNNPKMTFSSIEIQQHLKQTGYLGLIRNYDKDVYQFLHLSIQEFLAAWWIAKYNENTEEIFNAHFDDDHFRMCLRFVAGLTHLKPEKNYQQYFNKELDLQCKRKPLFGIDACFRSRFYCRPEIRLFDNPFLSDHVFNNDNNNTVDALLQLLYESQNETLCQILAQSITNHNLCLFKSIYNFQQVSQFDILCYSYFLNHCRINHLHLGIGSDEYLQILTSKLENNSQHNQCKILEIYLKNVSTEQVVKLFQSSLLYSIQECYMSIDSFDWNIFLTLLQLPQLKILHIKTGNSILQIPVQMNIQQCIADSSLQELMLDLPSLHEYEITNYIIDGIAKNNSITSLTYTTHPMLRILLSNPTIIHLLKNNHTLEALHMYPLEYQQPSSIAEINTPLTALGFDSSYSLHVKELQCLKLYHQYCTGTRQPHLIFDSYPNLQVLDISLDDQLHANELFVILTSNTTLKALRVHLYRVTDTICTSLKDMLAKNQTIQCLAIEIAVNFVQSMSFIMSYLTTGLSCNNSLQELSVPIPLPHINNEQLQTYFNVISQKYNLTKLKLNLTVDQYYVSTYPSLYYEQVLPLVTNILNSHKTIRLLHVQSFSIDNRSPQPHWRKSIQQLFQAVLSHPSLEYIGIERTQLLQDTFKAQKETLYKESKQPPPIIDIDSFP